MTADEIKIEIPETVTVADTTFRVSTKVADSFVNQITAVGTGADAFTSTQYIADRPISPASLSAMYTGFWLARKVVEEFPTQALRQGFEIEGDESGEALKAFQRVDRTEANPRGQFLRAAFLGRLYGGAALILGVKSGVGDTAMPMGAKVEVLWLDVATRHQLQIAERDTDPNSGRFGLPTVYRITGTHARKDQMFHFSRIVLFEGADPPSREEHSLFDLQGIWWLSILQTIEADLKRFGMSWAGISTLIGEASVGKFKMKGLFEFLSSGSQTEIEKRMLMMSQGKSIARSIFLDVESGEDFTRETVNFAALPDLMVQMALTVSGATQIPVTILFGQAPAGLNATGESDMRQFYDRISAYQETSIRPKLERLLALIVGREVKIDFSPLWEMSDTEKAAVRLTQAQADQVYYNMGADGSEILLSRVKDQTLGLDLDRAELEKRLKAEREAAANPPKIDPQGAVGTEQNGAPGPDPNISARGNVSTPGNPSDPAANTPAAE